ncbi:MAG: 16S rRNA (adenine(1518)-N(6)/adenine(1519)-N(6))-dimethyltransferase RsmA [Acidimicrobiales bacterium]|nr:16S rRNA (adenine(1518)-N(6)/adenine(1519)-N(6))-dimethyltransferase RsmA [Acidimicrobiales bacterium]
MRDLLARHGLEPSRALGQNFVADANTVRRVARLAGVGAGDRVIEIGAGLGSLTLALTATGAQITAIEIDRHLVPVLRSVVEPEGATVVQADALSLDWHGLLGPAGDTPSWVLVANLPYNIATVLLLDLLADVPQIDRMLVMVQLEAGERLAATPGSKAYGIPSVKVAWWAEARLVGRVPWTVFVPPPRVESALVELRRRPVPGDDAARRAVFALVDAGFGQRRKMLRRALADHVGPGAFAAAAIRPEARAEELELADWLRLAAAAETSG